MKKHKENSGDGWQFAYAVLAVLMLFVTVIAAVTIKTVIKQLF